MPKVHPLPPERLRARLDPAKAPFDSSDAAAPRRGLPPDQPRAVAALELGLHIKSGEYHIYLAGEPELGRTFFVTSMLSPRAGKQATPPDWVYLNNFEDDDKPILARMPTGLGREFKASMSRAVGRVREEIPLRLEQEGYQKKRLNLRSKFQTTRDTLYSEMEHEAVRQGFSLAVDEDGGMTLSPLVEGKILSAVDYERLDPEAQQVLKVKREKILSSLTRSLRELKREERGLIEDELNLERETVNEVLDEHLGPLEKEYGHIERIGAHLAALKRDILDNLDQFLPRPEEAQAAPPAPGQPDSGDGEVAARYGVNLFVDNSQSKGAPIVVEDHPTFFNLLGSIERESELGALYTDFTLVKAGAIHRANGGYLVLQAEDVLTNPSAWEGLTRALRAGQARIEDPAEHEAGRTRTIEPEPMPLDLKVVLIGTDEIYDLLLTGDSRFRKLFKIKAHMQDTVARTPASIKGFLRECGAMARDTGLPSFDRAALAGLADFSSRLAGDQTKLSLHYPLVRDLMIEAAALAGMEKREGVDGETLARAEAARDFRANLYEEEFLADYDREIIKVPTRGSAVGRVNGLSVSYFGDYAFGLPHQIACTVGVGEGGIIDLEREAMLGGPIHTKAMMILKSYLLGRFAHDKPLILAGSLYFEQSYAHVEGDSASGAELTALLSALAEAPIALNYAVTGAVNQSGAIMAVGDVTRKIEGFFEVCRRRGLTGDQGVLIPADNVVNLTLKPEVVNAVREGKFAIYPMATIEQVMELLTGLPAGKRRKDGTFTPGSVFRRVDDRLKALAAAAIRFRKRIRA